MARHLVARQRLEIVAADRATAERLADRAAVLAPALATIVARRLDAADDGTRRRLDRVELHLPRCDPRRFAESLAAALDAALAAALPAYLSRTPPVDAVEDALDVLNGFVGTGVLPWWSAGAEALRTAAATLAGSAEARAASGLRFLLQRPGAAARLARVLPDAVLATMVARLAGTPPDAIAASVRAQVAAAAGTDPVVAARRAWATLLDRAAAGGGGSGIAPFDDRDIRPDHASRREPRRQPPLADDAGASAGTMTPAAAGRATDPTSPGTEAGADRLVEAGARRGGEDRHLAGAAPHGETGPAPSEPSPGRRTSPPPPTAATISRPPAGAHGRGEPIMPPPPGRQRGSTMRGDDARPAGSPPTRAIGHGDDGRTRPTPGSGHDPRADPGPGRSPAGEAHAEAVVPGAAPAHLSARDDPQAEQEPRTATGTRSPHSARSGAAPREVPPATADVDATRDERLDAPPERSLPAGLVPSASDRPDPSRDRLPSGPWRPDHAITDEDRSRHAVPALSDPRPASWSPRTSPSRAPDHDALHLDHAGAVLLTPFYPVWFAAAGLVDADHRFVGDVARARAAAMIDHLATGDRDPPEPRLPLAKLLAGSPVDARHDPGMPLTDAEVAATGAMLAAALAAMPMLGHLSPAGLRDTWLVRPGRLAVEHGGWAVRIERRTVDILLGRLPWAIDRVALPWMPDPVRIEW